MPCIRPCSLFFSLLTYLIRLFRDGAVTTSKVDDGRWGLSFKTHIFFSFRYGSEQHESGTSNFLYCAVECTSKASSTERGVRTSDASDWAQWNARARLSVQREQMSKRKSGRADEQMASLNIHRRSDCTLHRVIVCKLLTSKWTSEWPCAFTPRLRAVRIHGAFVVNEQVEERAV